MKDKGKEIKEYKNNGESYENLIKLIIVYLYIT